MSIWAQLGLTGWYAVCLGTPVAINAYLSRSTPISGTPDIDTERNPA